MLTLMVLPKRRGVEIRISCRTNRNERNKHRKKRELTVENLVQRVPPVHLQDPLVVLRKGAVRLHLPEHPGTRPDKVVVEVPLVEAALPPPPVQRLQRPAARGDALEPGQRRHARRVARSGQAAGLVGRQ